MEGMDKKQFAVLMGMLSTAYGDNPSSEKLDIYYECVKDIPVDILKLGIYSLLKRRKYPKFPLIAEIRESCLGSEEDIESAALNAWNIAVTKYHGNADPILDEAIRLAFGGWDGWDNTYIENQVADRAHFIRCYKSLAGRMMATAKLLSGGGTKRELPEGKK